MSTPRVGIYATYKKRNSYFGLKLAEWVLGQLKGWPAVETNQSDSCRPTSYRSRNNILTGVARQPSDTGWVILSLQRSNSSLLSPPMTVPEVLSNEHYRMVELQGTTRTRCPVQYIITASLVPTVWSCGKCQKAIQSQRLKTVWKRIWKCWPCQKQNLTSSPTENLVSNVSQ